MAAAHARGLPGQAGARHAVEQPPVGQPVVRAPPIVAPFALAALAVDVNARRARGGGHAASHVVAQQRVAAAAARVEVNDLYNARSARR